MALFMLFACGPEPAPQAEDPLPTPWDVDEPMGEPPQLTAEDAAATLATVFGGVFDYNAQVLFDAYAEAMAWSDKACPPIASGDNGSMWDTVGCTTESGAEFSGFVSAFIGMQGEFDVQVMRGEATIDLPDQSSLTIAGDATTKTSPNGWYSQVLGVMRYDGPASAGTWIVDQPDLNLAYTLSISPDSGALSSAEIDGSVSGLPGSVTAVAFTDLLLSTASTCTVEPAGTVALRDANGVWASLTFDVTGSVESGWTVPDGECDGCAELLFDGTSLGTVCVDTDLILNTELPPW